MSQEMFQPLRTWDEQQKRHITYQVVKCSTPDCKRFENVMMAQGKHLPPEVIVKRMQNKGWVMGHRRAHDLCPTCAANKWQSKAHLKLVKDPPMPVEEKPVANRAVNVVHGTPIDALPNGPSPKFEAVPKKATREEKRIILAAIEDHYSKATGGGYNNGYTDARIATEFSVPIEWVSELRDEFFGPATNTAIQTLIKDLQELEARQIRTREVLTTAMNQSVALGSELKELRERIEQLQK